MVQDAGADSLRLDIVIETIAKIQAIDDVSARLQKLSVHSIQARDAAGRFTGELEGRMTPALKKSGTALSSLLSTGFGPKFIGSVTGVNAALVSAGKTFQNYTKTALDAGAISKQTAQNFSEISQGMIGIGITGKATTATFDELNTNLEQLRPRTEAGQAGIKALSNELSLLKIQFIEAGNAAEARFNKPLSQSQKAGQGLLLSFSISQLAAGRLSQAMFGLGFAILFTGKKFLNFTTITVALGAALASVLLDKIIASFQKADTVTEQVSKAMERFNQALDEAKGKPRLLAEEFQTLAESQEDFVIGFDKLIDRIENPPDPKGFFESIVDGYKEIDDWAGRASDSFDEFLEKIPILGVDMPGPVFGPADIDTSGVNELEQELLKVAQAGGDVDQALADATASGREFEGVSVGKDTLADLETLSAAVIGASTASIDALSEIGSESRTLEDDFSSLIEANRIVEISFVKIANSAPVQVLTKTQIEALEATQALIMLAASGGDVLAFFRSLPKEVQFEIKGVTIEGIADAANELLSLENTVRDSMQSIRDQTSQKNALALDIAPLEQARADLDAEFKAITGTIRDELDKQIDIIREGLETQTRERRDALEEEIRLIRDRFTAQTDIIREELETQIAARREALREETLAIRDAFDERVRDLRDTLSKQIDLIRDNLDDRIDLIKSNAQAEIDANKDRIDEIKDQERELEKVLSDLQSRRAQIRAEILGAEAQRAELERRMRQQGVTAIDEMAIIEARIEGLETEEAALADAIAGREEALEGIQAQIEAIEALIERIEDARKEAIKAARDEADARIDAIRAATDEDIRQINRARDNAIRAAQDRANAEIKAATKAADSKIDAVNRARDNAINAAQDIADAEIRESQRAANRLMDDKRRLADAVKAQQDAEKTRRSNLIAQASDAVRREHELANTLRTQVIPALEQILKIRALSLGIQTGNIADMPTAQLMILINNLGLGFSGQEIVDTVKAIKGFQLGGIVPGAPGQPRLIMAHGGEEVLRPDQQALPSGTLAPVNIIIENLNASSPADMHRLEKTISRAVGRKTLINLRSRRIR